MIVLLDLDGTLTDTAKPEFKRYKDGEANFVVSDIPVIQGAKEFIQSLKQAGHCPIIASDSHPKYVDSIATQIFDVPCVALLDKPNDMVLRKFLKSNLNLLGPGRNEIDNYIFVGDSWLDVEIARRLKMKSILTRLYTTVSSNVDVRDGIGLSWKGIKSGPTYIANSYDEIFSAINQPIKHLLSIEAIFQGVNSDRMVKFLYRKDHNRFAAYRCLARQEDGYADRFARADKYYEIDRIDRSPELLDALSKGLENYLKRVARYPQYKWDYITYVPDKKTTQPPNKMKEIFDLIDTSFSKVSLFEWDDHVTGRLREQPNYKSRREFIRKYINTTNINVLSGKNVIVIDDQFTSSATANEITSQLRNSGVNNVLFIAMFYLITPVNTKECPMCNEIMSIKVRRRDGQKFYSCTPPRFGGRGCGNAINLV
jgi:phosphoglycolate phosphatase-like HAD superfamily hydrolase